MNEGNSKGRGVFMHYVYIVECSDQTLYTGYAKDVFKDYMNIIIQKQAQNTLEVDVQ